MIDTTGLRAAVEQHMAIASVEYAIDAYAQARHSTSIDERLDAGEKLYAATVDAWVLLNTIKVELPRIGPIGIV